MASLLAAIVIVTVALCVGAVYVLRHLQPSSPTARVLAGLMAGYGAFLFAYLLFERRSWPLVVMVALAAIAALLRGRPHGHRSHT